MKTPTQMDAEKRRARLKELVLIGRQRGYINYSELAEQLPSEVIDSEQGQAIIGMLNDLGIEIK